jgi:hypothetical protein
MALARPAREIEGRFKTWQVNPQASHAKQVNPKYIHEQVDPQGQNTCVAV